MPDNTANYTPEEQKNIDLAKEYISISYDSQRASAEAVKHLCAPGNTFTARRRFQTFTLWKSMQKITRS
ncbi:MAG: hypothetical protein JO185_20320 [Acidobacteriaceae bacterium]|nr:hypothetical protein [Acidobacteriaceae bacterium]MBV9939877.1 hypothetical protein [Acidobacteriaceae bacterium]